MLATFVYDTLAIIQIFNIQASLCSLRRPTLSYTLPKDRVRRDVKQSILISMLK